LFTADTFDATTMAECGVVTEVVTPGELGGRAAEVAATLAERSPRSIALLKAMVHDSDGPEWMDVVEANLATFRDGWHSPDLREGMRAYTERRPPEL
jgi:enoyl-CoA hydratase/carnithine racemase